MQMKRILVVGFCALTLAIVVLFWRAPFGAALLLLVLHTAMLFYLGKRRLLVTYLFGFIFGSLSEVLSVGRGVWAYTLPQVFGIPLWLPFVWGAAAITIAYFYSLKSPYE